MRYMLDTNTLIYLIKHQPASVAERVDALSDADTLCMSFITFAELLKGAEGSTRRADTLRRLEQIVQQVPVLYATTRKLCELYASQSMLLKRAGQPIGANDLWIASHALAEGATLVTNNLREFTRVQGLLLENWVSVG
jgi:tRNA(fMet)-specific endonuclease VapC